MKILTINQRWFVNEWQSMGHTVLSCGFSTAHDIRLPDYFIPSKELLKLLPRGFYPDLILYLDDGVPYALPDLHNLTIPKIFYSVDTHQLGFTHFGMTHLFDLVYTAQLDYLSGFDGDNVEWLPLWATRPTRPRAVKKYQALFVGTLDAELNPLRVELVKAIQEQAPLETRQGPFWNFYPEASIVLNQAVKGDLNFRVFETLGCGALLLTDRIQNGLTTLFEENVHYIGYEWNNPSDAAKQINRLLKNNREKNNNNIEKNNIEKNNIEKNNIELQQVAAQGYREVLEKHTAYNRAHQILQKAPVTQTVIEAQAAPALLKSLLVWALLFDCLKRKSALKGYNHALQLAQQLIQAGHKLPADTLVLLELACLCYDCQTNLSTGKRLLTLIRSQSTSDQELLNKLSREQTTLYQHVSVTLEQMRLTQHQRFLPPAVLSGTTKPH